MIREAQEVSGRHGEVDAPAVILVVDDEALVRLTVAEYLRVSGYDVVEAVSGDEAASILGTGAVVDLVFSDIRMPGRLDGYALAHWVRDHRPDIPVLLTSGYRGAVNEAASRASHPIPVLAKPYRYEALLRQLSGLLRDRHARR